VGTGLTAIVAGSAAGGAVVCLALFAATTASARALPPVAPALAGVGGLLAGGLVSWSLARPIENAYYRAVLGMLGVFGTVIIAALAVPAHVAAGRWGLAALGAGCVAAIPLARRYFLGRGE